MNETAPVGQEKRCTRCGETKPLDAFAETGGGRWRRRVCRRCCTQQTNAAHRRAYTPAPQRTQIAEGATAKCADCGETKPATAFNLRAYKGRVTTLAYCRDCSRTRAVARYHKRGRGALEVRAEGEGVRFFPEVWVRVT